jgi:TolB-like protein/Tfp pilus assembly protein PilF
LISKRVFDILLKSDILRKVSIPRRKPEGSGIVCFATFEVDLESGELRRQGVKIRLTEQAFQVLAALIEHPGDVVRRKELRDRLWPGVSFVDFDHGLNKAINRLRDTLNDSATNPRFIETVARRGYRFIVPVVKKGVLRSTSVVPKRPRLAVLPFESIPPDPAEEFFADGLTEEMISELGRLNPSRLGVIARTSAMQYKRTTKRVDEIGTELDVDYILEGSVRRSESRARITMQLIQVRDQTHLWAESYNRHLTDILQVQHEVAQRVATSLALELLPQGKRRRKLVSPEAYEAYLRGRFFWNKGTDKGLHSAIECFEQALKYDPSYALAYSGMADSYFRLGLYFVLPSREAGAKTKAAASRALKIDDQLGEAHASMATVHCWYDWHWAGAEREFRRAIELKPNYAAAHNWYAAYLNAMLRFDEAAAEQRIAEELDPLSLMIAVAAADAYYFSRQYPSAIQCLQQVLRRNPEFASAHFNLGRAYLRSGMHQEAITEFEAAARFSGVRQAELGLACAYARAGDAKKAHDILRDLEEFGRTHYLPSPYLATLHLGLGDSGRALELLEQGFNEKCYLMMFLNADPVYDDIRAHPAFIDLIQRMGFPQYSA